MPHLYLHITERNLKYENKLCFHIYMCVCVSKCRSYKLCSRANINCWKKNLLLEGYRWSGVESVMKDCFCFQHTTSVPLTGMPRAES